MNDIQYAMLEAKARNQAIENIEKFGMTSRLRQLTIMQEQLGKLSRAHTHNYLDIETEYIKLYKLMAMCYTYWIDLEMKRYNAKYNEKILNPTEEY